MHTNIGLKKVIRVKGITFSPSFPIHSFILFFFYFPTLARCAADCYATAASIYCAEVITAEQKLIKWRISNDFPIFGESEPWNIENDELGMYLLRT